MIVVGSEIDTSSERIIKYLSDTHGVNINAATFQYFLPPDGSELLARVFLIEPRRTNETYGQRGGEPHATPPRVLQLWSRSRS